MTSFEIPPAVGSKAKCPVSGETFVVDAETERATHDGKHYAFCCDPCVGKFAANPAKFSKK